MSIAATVRTRVKSSPSRLVTLREFQDLPRGAVKSELRRLVDRGLLQHPRRGVYVSGHEMPSSYEIMHVLSRGRVYPVGATAAHLLTLGKPPLVAEYATTLGEIYSLGSSQVRMVRKKSRSRHLVEPLEAGFLDILPSIEQMTADLEHTLEILVTFVSDPLRVLRLLKAAGAESRRTQQRLAVLLQWAGQEYLPESAALPSSLKGRARTLGPFAEQLQLPL